MLFLPNRMTDQRAANNGIRGNAIWQITKKKRNGQNYTVLSGK